MKKRSRCKSGGFLIRLSVVSAVWLGISNMALGNGGPFVVKYPNGDPAAKGVLARLDPDLKPGRETRLRVVKEDLAISFDRGRDFRATLDATPLAHVVATYTIGNPTDEEVDVDFGFPILRGIYMDPRSMMPQPDVRVSVDAKYVKADIISNSVIYGIIRAKARKVIEQSVATDRKLSELAEMVAASSGAARAAEKRSLVKHLVSRRKWTERNALLMAEYCAIDPGKSSNLPAPGRGLAWWSRDEQLRNIPHQNLGLLSAIGEKKATQLFAQLAALFDPTTASAYEDIFAAWGGDVRERSIDLASGLVRPREISTAKKGVQSGLRLLDSDPTVYARVEYLDSTSLSDEDKSCCRTILKNLPVIFTFAPMNLLHYRVKFAPRSEQVVAVSYRQYAYRDTKEKESYQLSYVIHPASHWDEFGPINLTVNLPDSLVPRISAPCSKGTVTNKILHVGGGVRKQVKYASYTGQVQDKTGELFIGIDARSWKSAMGPPSERKAALVTGSDRSSARGRPAQKSAGKNAGR